jgi:hypothetical protein
VKERPRFEPVAAVSSTDRFPAYVPNRALLRLLVGAQIYAVHRGGRATGQANEFSVLACLREADLFLRSALGE